MRRLPFSKASASVFLRFVLAVLSVEKQGKTVAPCLFSANCKNRCAVAALYGLFGGNALQKLRIYAVLAFGQCSFTWSLNFVFRQISKQNSYQNNFIVAPF